MASRHLLGLAAALPAAAPLHATEAQRPLIVAHRGGTGEDPENTALAVTQTIANGADAIWLTVRISRVLVDSPAAFRTIAPR